VALEIYNPEDDDVAVPTNDSATPGAEISFTKKRNKNRAKTNCVIFFYGTI